MHLYNLIEHVMLAVLAVTLGYVLWQQRRRQLKKLWEAAKKAARKRRKWKPKTPRDCPACESGVRLAVRPIRRNVQPWRERKSTRGRRKRSLWG